VPNSYSYTTIKGDLKDAFVNYGNGFGWTFNSSIYKLRLDYVFYDQNFEVNDFGSENHILPIIFPSDVF